MKQEEIMQDSSYTVTHRELANEDATRDLARYIAPLLTHGDILCLYGNLGSGKTFFARALALALGVAENVDSPSFVLFKEYEGGGFRLYHLDLYRLKDENEVFDLGILDMIESGITLIEWPELAESILPYRSLELRFSFDGFHRSVELRAFGRFKQLFHQGG